MLCGCVWVCVCVWMYVCCQSTPHSQATEPLSRCCFSLLLYRFSFFALLLIPTMFSLLSAQDAFLQQVRLRMNRVWPMWASGLELQNAIPTMCQTLRPSKTLNDNKRVIEWYRALNYNKYNIVEIWSGAFLVSSLHTSLRDSSHIVLILKKERKKSQTTAWEHINKNEWCLKWGFSITALVCWRTAMKSAVRGAERCQELTRTSLILCYLSI